MGNTILLSQLKIGEKARVTNIHTVGVMRRRLRDIGIIRGTLIECVLKSPSGNPAAYKIRDSVIALRSEDSCQIDVECQ